MADAIDISSRLANLNLGCSADDTERSERLWNRPILEMKFTIEKVWLGAVWNCTNKPNYGMRDLDPIFEERASNKLELTGPLIDGYLQEIGKGMFSKLGRSRNTGLMPPIKLFVPYTIFHHICNVCVGYGGCLTNDKTSMSVTIKTFTNASKVFSPVRFLGQNFLKKRHFNKTKVNDRNMLTYAGRAAVVVDKATPLMLEYKTKQQKLTVTFYVQRYDRSDFAMDSRLQALMNKSTV